MSGISADRCPYSGEPFFRYDRSGQMSEESDGHRYKNTKNILSENTKNPLQNLARDEVFRGTTQVHYAGSIMLSFKHVTCAKRQLLLNNHVHSCGSGVKVNDYLVFKGTFSRWFPLSGKSIIICDKNVCTIYAFSISIPILTQFFWNIKSLRQSL